MHRYFAANWQFDRAESQARLQQQSLRRPLPRMRTRTSSNPKIAGTSVAAAPTSPARWSQCLQQHGATSDKSARSQAYDFARRPIILDPGNVLGYSGASRHHTLTLAQANARAFESHPGARPRAHTLHLQSRVPDLFPSTPADLKEDWL